MLTINTQKLGIDKTHQYRELKIATKFLLSAIIKVPLTKDKYRALKGMKRYEKVKNQEQKSRTKIKNQEQKSKAYF
jgi:hypothetical protein